MNKLELPSEIVSSFYPQKIKTQAAIVGGEINNTFLITDAHGEKTILQRLSKIYDHYLEPDYQVVSAHLRERGWQIAQPLTTPAGEAYLVDKENRLWRGFEYLTCIKISLF
jgi:hypothetical protein